MGIPGTKFCLLKGQCGAAPSQNSNCQNPGDPIHVCLLLVYGIPNPTNSSECVSFSCHDHQYVFPDLANFPALVHNLQLQTNNSAMGVGSRAGFNKPDASHTTGTGTSCLLEIVMSLKRCDCNK